MNSETQLIEFLKLIIAEVAVGFQWLSICVLALFAVVIIVERKNKRKFEEKLRKRGYKED